MTRTILTPVLLFAISFVANAGSFPAAQVTASRDLGYAWARTWGGGYSHANRVAVDGAGHVYVAGEFSGTVDFDPDPAETDFHTSTNDSIDASLSMFDSSGEFLWAITWGGGEGRDVAYGVGLDTDGNAYVVGAFRYSVDFNPDPTITETHTSNAISENNIYLSKFSSDGAFQWVRTWGPSPVPGRVSFGAEAYAVAVAGSYLYVVGDFSGDQTDFDPWGDHDWHQNHIPASGPIFFDAFLTKFDLDGSLQWAKTWGGEGYDDGPGVALDNAGNVYVAGMYASQDINFDPAGGSGGLGHPAHDSGILVDVFLTKFDSSGNFVWVKTWGGQGTEDAMGTVAVDGSNHVYVAGRYASIDCDFNPEGTPDIHSTNGGQDAFVGKFDTAGNFQWARTWGGTGRDMAGGLAVDEAGDVHVSGIFSSTVNFDPGGAANLTSAGGQDAYVSTFSPSGTFRWVKAWGGSGDDWSYHIAQDGAGNLYAVGAFQGTVDFDPGSGIDNHSADGQSNAFLSKFVALSHTIYLPLIVTHLDR